MKKIFIALSLILFVLVGSVFGILFTKPGNDLIASYIENKVNSQRSDVNLKVNNLELSFSSINFNATVDDNSIIVVKGALQVFAKEVDLTYNINIKDLSKLEALTNQKLNGSFSTSGTVKGNEASAIIDGISNVASSDTKYNIQLVKFEPSSVIFNMKNAKVDELLHLVNQKKLASGLLTIDANIKDAKLPSLDGTIISTIVDGKINNSIVNTEFKQNINVPITFKSRTNAILTPNLVTAKTALLSSLANVTTNETKVLLDESKIETDYKLDIKDLSKLESIIATKLNGAFETKGKAVVNNGIVKIDGDTNIFDSLSKYSVKIANSKPEYVKFDITNAKLEKLLYTVNQPKYATGKVDVTGDIKSADITNLDGLIVTKITDGKVMNKIVNKQFNQKLKKPISFKGDVNTKLAKTQAISDAKINSTMADVIVKKAIFDLKDASLNSDYLVKVADFSKLYDVTQMKMRGKADISGNVKSQTDLLLVTGASKLLGGNLDFKLNNDDFNANVKGVGIKQLTHMLYYPEVFDSTSDLSVKYNLLSKKGDIAGNLIKGRFLPNDVSSIINQFSRFDLTREIYETVDIKSSIDDLVLNSVDRKSVV